MKNITNRDSAKSIFDSLEMNHEGNEKVKETKVLASIQKYEAFKMEEDETIEDILKVSNSCGWIKSFEKRLHHCISC